MNRTSINFDLSNQNLRPVIIRPIMKAIYHQHCLGHLDLSNNFMLDEGLKYLTQAIATLKNLSYLDLSGNGLTENGIEFFCTSIENSTSPGEIKQLKLNFNPIKSKSLRYLSKLCRCKSTSILSLVSCKLIEFDNEIESFKNVKELNISYNQLSKKGLRNFLRKLNFACIESINMERCSMEEEIGEVIVDFMTSNCVLSTIKEMNLSGLKLNENELLDIFCCIQKACNLKFLDVSYQHELTELSLKFILFHINNDNLSVNLAGCRRLKYALNIKLDERTTSLPCHLKFSLPTKSDEKSEYVSKMKDLWMSLTESRGTIHHEKCYLHLLTDIRNLNEFLLS